MCLAPTEIDKLGKIKSCHHSNSYQYTFSKNEGKISRQREKERELGRYGGGNKSKDKGLHTQYVFTPALVDGIESESEREDNGSSQHSLGGVVHLIELEALGGGIPELLKRREKTK